MATLLYHATTSRVRLREQWLVGQVSQYGFRSISFSLQLLDFPLESLKTHTHVGFDKNVMLVKAKSNLDGIDIDISLSPRVNSVKPSKTLAISGLATSLVEAGVSIIRLAAGEPPAVIAERSMDLPILLIKLLSVMEPNKVLFKQYLQFVPLEMRICLPKKLLEEIAQIVAKHPRLLVLSDEIYEHIIYTPATHTNFASLPGMWDRTLTVNGFSKAFAMTGLAPWIFCWSKAFYYM